jgi:predicted nucleic acid-binding protein
VIVYAFQKRADDRRSERARELLLEGGIISVQVLNEFASVARRKLKFTWVEISESLEAICALCPKASPLTMSMHRAAVDLSVKYGYDIYDSLVIATAEQAGCDTLYSEDMADNQRIGNVTIRNPFVV